MKCDYCGDIYSIAWYSYISLKKKENNSDCCGNPGCTYKKSVESLKKKYDTENPRHIVGANEKIKETCLQRYGVENPFQAEEIKEKIKATNKEKYGTEYAAANPSVRQRYEETCLERYGVPCYPKSRQYREQTSGANNPRWKGGISKKRDERATKEYSDWRKSVFIRDRYSCQCCGAKSMVGRHVQLCAHHIFNWKDYEELRYSIDNGITLCQKCHNAFHSLFGKRSNNQQQLNQFLQIKKYAELTGNEL